MYSQRTNLLLCYQMFSLTENESPRKQLWLYIISDRAWPQPDFQSPVKNRFSLPNFIFYPIFSQCCTTPTLFLLKLKCFPPLLPFNIPCQACHLLYICTLQATASNQKDQAFRVWLSTRGRENNMLKGGTSSWQDAPKWDGCEAEGAVWECPGGSTVLKHRRHWAAWHMKVI